MEEHTELQQQVLNFLTVRHELMTLDDFRAAYSHREKTDPSLVAADEVRHHDHQPLT
jgi:phosphodiesterase/alkaline phosphatase D-like protein